MCIRTVYVHIYNIYAVAFVFYTAQTLASNALSLLGRLDCIGISRAIPLEGIRVGEGEPDGRGGPYHFPPQRAFSPSG